MNKITYQSLILLGLFTITGCQTTKTTQGKNTITKKYAPCTLNEEGKHYWHGIAISPKDGEPNVSLVDHINPVWWLGNSRNPQAPEWYMPDNPLRNTAWYIRNPFDNFTRYVIGFADKETVRYGVHPESLSNPHGGWNFSITKYKCLYLPFIDYRKGTFEFYFGWRKYGDFGIKLNFKKSGRKESYMKAHPKK